MKGHDGTPNTNFNAKKITFLFHTVGVTFYTICADKYYTFFGVFFPSQRNSVGDMPTWTQHGTTPHDKVMD